MHHDNIIWEIISIDYANKGFLARFFSMYWPVKLIYLFDNLKL